MNPMYQAMLATNPLQAQQQQLSYYQPTMQQQPQSNGGQMGMSLGQMIGKRQQTAQNDASRVNQIQSDGMPIW